MTYEWLMGHVADLGLDGIDTTDPVTETFGTNFNFDAIAEISFQTAGFAAEFGRATGGVVNIVTKSGGNQFSIKIKSDCDNRIFVS